ncbi:MAG TPA: glycosyltransferase family 2 protein [Thermoleophilaceae bacterium]|nr:glycosyltransferase family 2 protein [Thermoleophilaceae bacterium]
MTEISVVIPTRNRAERLRALLVSLAEQDGPPFEVIVVDNASEDATLLEVGEADAVLDAHVRAMHLPQPMGPAVARNRGWRAAQGQLVVFTDDDVVAQPGWLAAIAAAHARDPEAVIQGRTEPDPRELHRLSAFSRSQHATGPGPWFQTCNIAYPRSLLERVGGFDESFWDAAGEDTDLGWRAIEAGARVVYEPAALNWHAVHEHGAWALIRASQKWRLVVRNAARHPQIRAALHRRVFWKPAHERFLVAAGCVALAATSARRSTSAASFTLASAALASYAAVHRTQHGSYPGTIVALPAHAALDAAEVVAMVRGSIEARTLML